MPLRALVMPWLILPIIWSSDSEGWMEFTKDSVSQLSDKNRKKISIYFSTVLLLYSFI